MGYSPVQSCFRILVLEVVAVADKLLKVVDLRCDGRVMTFEIGDNSYEVPIERVILRQAISATFPLQLFYCPRSAIPRAHVQATEPVG